jgi:hypothetical protein
LLTDLESLKAALECYAKRGSIKPMFRDFKSGGYHLEDMQLTDQHFLAIVLLIAIAYTLATNQGNRPRQLNSS